MAESQSGLVVNENYFKRIIGGKNYFDSDGTHVECLKIEHQYQKFFESLNGQNQGFLTVEAMKQKIDGEIKGIDANNVIARIRASISSNICYAAFLFKLFKIVSRKAKKILDLNNVQVTDQMKKTTLTERTVKEWSRDNYPFSYVGEKATIHQFDGSDDTTISLVKAGCITIADLNKAVFIWNVNLGRKMEFFKDKEAIKIRPCYSKNELKTIREAKKDALKKLKGAYGSIEEAVFAVPEVKNEQQPMASA